MATMADDSDVDGIRRRAAARGCELGLPYAGALLPSEAHTLMQAGARLVDVRTKPEVLYVGRVPGSVLIEWQTYPGSAANPAFLDQLAQAVEPGETLMFLCRSGQRSRDAAQAMTAAGYGRCYNVKSGFEGGPDDHRHRGTVAGWKADGLPWLQD